jgi:hypothetical protein
MFRGGIPSLFDFAAQLIVDFFAARPFVTYCHKI